jgi:hypothetical protein
MKSPCLRTRQPCVVLYENGHNLRQTFGVPFGLFFAEIRRLEHCVFGMSLFLGFEWICHRH